MDIIGLTGGIGTGKSTVSSHLIELGYKVIDADKISHDITAKGSPVLDEIRDIFGDEVFFADGEMNRKAVAAKVFSDAKLKSQLENITTNRIVEIIKEEIEKCEAMGLAVTFVDVPLLFEVGFDRMVDSVWLVVADLETRIERVMKRDNCSKEDVEKRISNQMSCDEKKKLSQEIIDNSLGKEELFEQIDSLIDKYAYR